MPNRDDPASDSEPPGSDASDSVVTARQQSSPLFCSQSVRVLFTAKEKRLLRPTQSESSLDCSPSRLSTAVKPLRRSCSEHLMYTCASSVDHSDSEETIGPTYLSLSNSFSSMPSVELPATESQTSGYTTESSYQTATAGSFFSLGTQHYLRATSDNYIQEVHVAMEANSTEAQIQAIRNDLRTLLRNEVTLITQASGGRQNAVYVIAYQFMPIYDMVGLRINRLLTL